mmetsp:Transcript_11291/g.19378  ORF Transcript_11291/g.19378 Transcript_11291/m.19378 type:complete len:174 (+) Transcript_11291:144-665(+)
MGKCAKTASKGDIVVKAKWQCTPYDPMLCADLRNAGVTEDEWAQAAAAMNATHWRILRISVVLTVIMFLICLMLLKATASWLVWACLVLAGLPNIFRGPICACAANRVNRKIFEHKGMQFYACGSGWMGFVEAVAIKLPEKGADLPSATMLGNIAEMKVAAKGPELGNGVICQ